MKIFLKSLLYLFLSLQVSAVSLIPKSLESWSDWVVRDQVNFKCPSSSSDPNQRECIWLSSIEISISKTKGSFKGTWKNFQEDLITLPGKNGQWPKNVKVNGSPAVVTEKNGLPSIRLKRGTYRITGDFSWKKAPLSLVLPHDVGLVRLRVYGRDISEPSFDTRGDLWLKGSQNKISKKKDFLQIKVFRKLTDEVPAIDETLVELSVGGTERELELASTLLEGFIPLNFNSTLPAKWESSGKLKLRVRPGKHVVNLKSRSIAALGTLIKPSLASPFPQQEVWSFVSKNQLRVVQIKGVEQIDSNQIQMPSSHKGYPTYLMNNQTKFVVEEISRGLKGKKENQLSLNRTHWLDFSGEKFTVKDQISGRVNNTWRLSMVSPFELGSVSSANKNQLVTIDPDGQGTGVEVREAQLNLSAESRLAKTGTKVPASGWNQDFKSIRGSFNIPPGWRPLALFGVDYSSGTWFSKWSLLSLFFVLVLSIGMFKLKGFKWSLITFFSLVLLIHEKNAPYWIWLHLLISLSLERAMKNREKINSIVRGYRIVCLFILVSISFPFIVQQVQKAIYPSLEKQSHNNSFYSSLGSMSESSSRSDSSKMRRKRKAKKRSKGIAVQSQIADFGGALNYEEELNEAPVVREKKMEFDPNSQIQTGPGIPNWKWGRVTYGWEGPVKKGQSISLITLSPWMNRLFTLLRILLLCLLLYCFADLKELRKSGFLQKVSKGVLSLFFIGVFSLAGVETSYAQNFPPRELLEDLKKELLKPEDCFPHCISIEKMNLAYTPEKLMIRLTVHAANNSYFSLPGSRSQWVAQKVLVDGKPSRSLKGSSQGLSLYLDKGIHDVVLVGDFAERSQIQIALGLKPKNISYSGSGWSVEGVRENGSIESSLTLYRLAKKKEGSTDIGSTLLPHFVKVERSLRLGLNWSVQTKITRLSPIGRAINLDVPKIKGERLTNSNVEDKGEFIKVSLGKSARTLSWSSILPETERLKLKATNDEMISELWHFFPGPIWRVEFVGLPMIRQVNSTSRFAPLYRPWPLEELELRVSRPKAAEGKAITLEQARLSISPGKRLTHYDLNMSFKTSMGVAHKIKLPKGSKLSSVKINGTNQPLELNESELRLPLGVGTQKVQVSWVVSEGIASLFKSPILDLGLKGINLKIQMRLSAKRWVIALGGPVMGPAVLFWGKLISLIIFSFFLSKIPWCPLSFTHWSVLSVGLTQGYNAGIFIVMGYLIFLSYRRAKFQNMNKVVYNLTSLVGLLGAFVSISTFFVILRNGLLGGPRMDIEGNESSAYILNWFVDRFDGTIPGAWIFSFPTLIYQLLMLIWAIWMTFSLIKWVPWLWEGLYGNTFFQKIKIDMKNKPLKKDNNTEEK